MADARSLLTEAIGLLQEAVAVELGEQWHHQHCDEDSDGNHRFDHEAWDSDAVDLVRRARSFWAEEV